LVDEGCEDQLSDIIEKLAVRQGQVHYSTPANASGISMHLSILNNLLSKCIDYIKMTLIELATQKILAMRFSFSSL